MPTNSQRQKHVFHGLVLGVIAAALWMIWLRYLTTILPQYQTSLAAGLTPWWQAGNWVSAAILGVVVFSVRWFVGRKPSP